MPIDSFALNWTNGRNIVVIQIAKIVTADDFFQARIVMVGDEESTGVDATILSGVVRERGMVKVNLQCAIDEFVPKSVFDFGFIAIEVGEKNQLGSGHGALLALRGYSVAGGGRKRGSDRL